LVFLANSFQYLWHQYCAYKIKTNILKKEKKVITPKRKEIIKNLSITISKESKKVNGRNIKLIEILQKKLDKIKP